MSLFKTALHQKTDEFRASGYMTAPDIARLYGTNAPHVRRAMVVPDKILKKRLVIFLYERVRVEAVFGEPKVVKNGN